MFATKSRPQVGRKWLTARAAVMRWVEDRLAAETAQLAFDINDRAAVTKALQSGAVRLKEGTGHDPGGTFRGRIV